MGPSDLGPRDLAAMELAVAPASDSFGGITVNAASTAHVFTVTVGHPAAALTVSLEGADPGDFLLSEDSCTGASPAAGATCTFKISFAPTALGARSASARVQAAGGSSVTATLVGTGAPPARLSVSPSPSPYDFGAVGFGATSPAATFTVSNVGGGLSGIVSITLGGPDAAQFAITSELCAGRTIDSTSTCGISVAFTPNSSAATARNATLQIQAAPGGTITIPLTGEGAVPAHLTLTSPESPFDFAAVTVNTHSATLDVVVTNDGGSPTGAPVEVALAGADPSHFEIVQDCGSASLAPLTACTVEVRFNPTVTAATSARLDIGAAPGGTVSIDLQGHGLNPAQLGWSGMLSYGNVPRGSTADLILTLANSGDLATGAPVSVTISPGGDAALFSVVSTSCSAALAPASSAGSSCTATVRFSPLVGTADGAKSAIVHAPPGSLVAALTLAAAAVDPSSLAITPAGSFTYTPAVTADGTTYSFKVFTVSNGGGAPSNTVTVSLSDSTNFVTQDDNCTGSAVPAAGSCTVTVLFRPQAGSSGAETTTLQVVEMGGATVTKTLNGTALAPAKLAWTTSGFNWGGVRVTDDDPALDQTFTLRNGGDISASALTISTAGATTEFFVESTTCTPSGALILGPGASCTVTGRFAPATAGSHTLQIVATATSGAPSGTSSTWSGDGQWQLNITKSGAASGAVTSSPAGINCDLAGTNCHALYDDGTVVTLTAAPGVGARFAAWTGCTPVAGMPQQCTLTMNANGATAGAKTVNADFELNAFTVTVGITNIAGAAGGVTSIVPDAQINCPGTCSNGTPYTWNSNVVLRATPSPGFGFAGWGGECSAAPNPTPNTTTTCMLNMQANKTPTAIFTPFNKAFVTSTSYLPGGDTAASGGTFGQFNSQASANARCAERAVAGGLGGTNWVAWLSVSGSNAKDLFGSSRGWVRPDQQPVIDTMSAFASTGQFFTSLAINELGNQVATTTLAWTGTSANGAASGTNCSGWTTTGSYGSNGAAFGGAGRWTATNNNAPCTVPEALYCFENDYSAVLTPTIPANQFAKLAFVTSTQYSLAADPAGGTCPTAGPALLDCRCQAEANSAGIGASTGRTYLAMIAQTGIPVVSRFAIFLGWYRVDGVEGDMTSARSQRRQRSPRRFGRHGDRKLLHGRKRVERRRRHQDVRRRPHRLQQLERGFDRFFLGGRRLVRQ